MTEQQYERLQTLNAQMASVSERLRELESWQLGRQIELHRQYEDAAREALAILDDCYH